MVQTRLTRNVVGMVRGTDRGLADTYVMLGAHYDHIGYRQFSEPASTAPDPLIAGCTGQSRPTSARATSSTTAPTTTGPAPRA